MVRQLYQQGTLSARWPKNVSMLDKMESDEASTIKIIVWALAEVNYTREISSDDLSCKLESTERSIWS